MSIICILDGRLYSLASRFAPATRETAHQIQYGPYPRSDCRPAVVIAQTTETLNNPPGNIGERWASIISVFISAQSEVTHHVPCVYLTTGT